MSSISLRFQGEPFKIIQIAKSFKMISFLFFVSAVGHLEKYSNENIKCNVEPWYSNSEMKRVLNNTGDYF